MQDRIKDFLSAYVSKAKAEAMATRFHMLEEAQQFVSDLLPKEKEEKKFQRHEVFKADNNYVRGWIEAERAKGNIVYTTKIKGQARARSMSSCSPVMWHHFKNDPDIEEVS